MEGEEWGRRVGCGGEEWGWRVGCVGVRRGAEWGGGEE